MAVSQRPKRERSDSSSEDEQIPKSNQVRTGRFLQQAEDDTYPPSMASSYGSQGFEPPRQAGGDMYPPSMARSYDSDSFATSDSEASDSAEEDIGNVFRKWSEGKGSRGCPFIAEIRGGIDGLPIVYDLYFRDAPERITYTNCKTTLFVRDTFAEASGVETNGTWCTLQRGGTGLGYERIKYLGIIPDNS